MLSSHLADFTAGIGTLPWNFGTREALPPWDLPSFRDGLPGFTGPSPSTSLDKSLAIKLSAV